MYIYMMYMYHMYGGTVYACIYLYVECACSSILSRTYIRILRPHDNRDANSAHAIILCILRLP